MTGIELYSTTAANNNSAPPDGWPEGQSPSSVNDCGRQMMAAIRTWYEDAEWIKWGDTTVYVAGTQFKIVGANVTSRYSVGRRVRAVGSSTGTIYGRITASSFSTDTTVTVVWDSGSLSNETLTVSISAIKGGTSSKSTDAALLNSTNTFTAALSMSGAAINEAAYSAVASAATTDLGAVNSNNVNISGTATITSFGTAPTGTTRRVVLTGTPTLTHNATSLYLPSGANIVGAVNDSLTATSSGSGNWIVTNYQRADGTPVGGASYKVLSATRDISLASGTQDVTGFGFTPKAVDIICGISGATYASWGFSDGTTNGCILSNAAGTADNFTPSTAASIALQVTGANAYSGTVAIIADGIRITWTKSGTPTGTATLIIKGYR